MRIADFTTRFRRDLKRQEKRRKDIPKLKALVKVICRDGDAPLHNRPHNLTGNYVGWRECHIEPDWLLIYAVDDDSVTFFRTGTHSDLFD